MELLLPIFPRDTILITPTIGVFERDGTIIYLQNGLPIYSHPKESLDHFRFFTAKLVTMGRCRQVDIVRAFNVSKDSVARSVKLYRTKGESGFFGPDKRIGKAHKMLPERRVRIQKMLDKGLSVNSIAKRRTYQRGLFVIGLKRENFKKKFRRFSLLQYAKRKG
jgi:transposase